MNFIGQAMASTAMSYSGVSCIHDTMTAKMSHSAMANNTSSTMSKANMMLADSESNTDMSMSMDCCQDECKCPMNGCVSLSFLLNTYTSSKAIAEQKILQLPLLHKSQPSSSLYRPPIS